MMQIKLLLFLCSCVITSILLAVSDNNEDWITKREWPYLTSEALKTRYAITAYLLRDSDTIVEIGGYKTPISDFVTDKTVIVIDPKMKAKNNSQVFHLPIKFQDWEEEQLKNSDYAVVILGLDLHMDNDAWQKLFKLINASRKTVIEFSTSYKPARKQFQYICENINKKPTLTMKLDLSNTDSSKYPEYYPFREIYCLEP
ncbi:MAG: hypothetical protein WAM28_08900 [Chlamydiales bacterium]